MAMPIKDVTIRAITMCKNQHSLLQRIIKLLNHYLLLLKGHNYVREPPQSPATDGQAQHARVPAYVLLLTVMAYRVMGCIVMEHIVVVCIVMAYIVMAYIVRAYIVMA